MGQYYRVANLDKKQVLKPHDFGHGAKLMEFAGAGDGMMRALAVLLADGNGRGGGDLDSTDPLVGSWAGDRIVVVGDYADDDRFVPGSLYEASNDYENISEKMKGVFRAAGES